jgi:hypothetical protein
MMLLTLNRFCHAPDGAGVFGTLTIDSAPEKRWFTVERPWRNNEAYVSCIPLGLYRLRHGTFQRGGGYPDLELVEVPGRSAIEIHAANFARELNGCIAVGKGLNLSRWMITESRKALRELLAVIGNEQDLALSVQQGGHTGETTSA